MPDKKLTEVDTSTSLADSDKLIGNIGNSVKQITLTNLVTIIKNKIGSLKNPHALTFTGAVDDTYDGSAAKTINIPTGSGGSGTTDYNDLENKPQINGVELLGNQSGNDIGLVNNQQGIDNVGKVMVVDKDGILIASDKLSQLSDDIDTFRSITFSKNLFDSERATVGFLLINGTISTDSSYSSYITSDFISVENGKKYTCSYVNEFGDISSTARIVAMLYDDEKNQIDDTYMNVDGIGYITIDNNINAKYLRVSYRSDVVYNQVEKAETYSYYVPYEKNITLLCENLIIKNSLDNKAILVLTESGEVSTDEELTDKVLSLDNDIVIKYSKNLFNIEKSVIGGIQYNGSISTSDNWSKYKTSELIPVKKDIQYTLSQFLNSNPYSERLVMILYDNKKKPLQETYNNITSAQSHTFTSQIDGYVRVSANFSNPSKQLMLEVGDSATEYEEWWEKRYTNLYVPIDRLPIHDALYGKKWIPCGDSFTDYTNALFDSGKFNGKAKTYPRLISERCGIEIDQSFFASGRTLAYPADGSFTNSLTCPTAECYYQNIPEDADYITIMLGINDGHHRDSSSAGDGEDNTGIIPIGTIEDDTTSTYYGAWNVVLTWLIENRPFAHIGILISNGVDTVDYRNAQLEIAKKYGIPYIDLNGDERTPTMIRSQNPNISSVVKTIVNKKQAVDYDGSLTGTVNTHPNSEAHEYESYFIESFLRSI